MSVSMAVIRSLQSTAESDRTAAAAAPSRPASYSRQRPDGDLTTIPQPCPTAVITTLSPGAAGWGLDHEPTMPTTDQTTARVAQVATRQSRSRRSQMRVAASDTYQPATHQLGGPATQA